MIWSSSFVRSWGAVHPARPRLRPDEHDYAQDLRRVEEDLSAIQAKKDRLLEMSIEGVISTAEFKQRNDGFNEQAKVLEERLAVLQSEAEKGQQTTAQLQEIRSAAKPLFRLWSFSAPAGGSWCRAPRR